MTGDTVWVSSRQRIALGPDRLEALRESLKAKGYVRFVNTGDAEKHIKLKTDA